MNINEVFSSDDILFNCFSFLDTKSLLQAGSTCSRWKVLADTPFFWKHLCKQRFGEKTKMPTEFTRTWKQCYRDHHLTFLALRNLKDPNFCPSETKIEVKRCINFYAFGSQLAYFCRDTSIWSEIIFNTTVVDLNNNNPVKHFNFSENCRVYDDHAKQIDNKIIKATNEYKNISIIDLENGKELHSFKAGLPRACNTSKNIVGFLREPSILELRDIISGEMLISISISPPITKVNSKIFITQERIILIYQLEGDNRIVNIYERSSGELIKKITDRFESHFACNENYLFGIANFEIYSIHLQTGQKEQFYFSGKLIQKERSCFNLAEDYLVFGNGVHIYALSLKNKECFEIIVDLPVKRVKTQGNLLFCDSIEHSWNGYWTVTSEKITVIDLDEKKIIRKFKGILPIFHQGRLIGLNVDFIHIWNFAKSAEQTKTVKPIECLANSRQ